MKRRIFWSVFFIVSLRLQIYEAIAAIFWQSASYVFFFFSWLIGSRISLELSIWIIDWVF